MGRLEGIVAEKLAMPVGEVNDRTAYNVAKRWDSITHLELVSAIESAFGVEFDVDETTAMSDVKAIRELLRKHGVSDA